MFANGAAQASFGIDAARAAGVRGGAGANNGTQWWRGNSNWWRSSARCSARSSA